MTDSEMIDLWKKENEILGQRLRVNEEKLKTLTRDKAVGEFDRLLKISMLGRNAALLYSVMSFICGFLILSDYAYSLPAFIGAIAMLWSFDSHRSLASMEYQSHQSLTILELQKVICNFRIHTARMKIYDIVIVILWFVTFIPAFLLAVFHVHVYGTKSPSVYYYCIALGIGTLIWWIALRIYDREDGILKRSEELLESIMQFEGKE